MTRSLTVALLAIACALPLAAQARKPWLLPSQTILAGLDPWITVDAAVSDDLFSYDMAALRLDALSITAPDGSVVLPQNPSTGKFRSTFDVQLQQRGSYRIRLLNDALMGQWDGEDGKPKRWRGTVDTLAAEVPQDARNLQLTQSIGRVDTFVTNGAPNDAAFKPSGQGLEMVPVTHPNDLVAGETATFRLLLDGKPAPGLDVDVVRGGQRYVDMPEASKVATDARGEFRVTWPQAGMYWLQASTQDTRTSVPRATQRRLSYAATLEVLAP